MDFRERALEQARDDEESTKAKILKAAEDLFARKGFKGATTRQIADAAGVNMAMINYHWGSKEELWNAVHADLIEQGFHHLTEELLAKYPRADNREELEGFIAVYFDYLADNPNLAKLGHAPGVEGGEKMWTKDMGALFFEGLRGYFKNNTSLEFKPADLSLAVFICAGAFAIFFYRPDLVELYFEEDHEDMTRKFRKKVASTIALMIERFGQMPE